MSVPSIRSATSLVVTAVVLAGLACSIGLAQEKAGASAPATADIETARFDIVVVLKEKSKGLTATLSTRWANWIQRVPDELKEFRLRDLRLESARHETKGIRPADRSWDLVMRDAQGKKLAPKQFALWFEHRPEPKGALMIHGGGRLTRGFVHRFTELAGGKDAPIVAIPTALGGDIDPKRYRERWLERAGFKNITILHTRDPKVADRDEFVAALKKAKGVWLSGGRQWRTADAYLNTKVQAEIQKLYERGGVVAGSSAGATIQGSYLVRGDTRGNRLMMSVGHEQGFGLLPNGAIDQHVIARKRLDDLVPVIERFPYLLGIGIDEGTAVVVQGSTFEVIGESKVAIYDARKWKKSDGEGVETSGGEAAERLRYDFLKPGQRFDWRQRKILEPLSQ